MRDRAIPPLAAVFTLNHCSLRSSLTVLRHYCTFLLRTCPTRTLFPRLSISQSKDLRSLSPTASCNRQNTLTVAFKSRPSIQTGLVFSRTSTGSFFVCRYAFRFAPIPASKPRPTAPSQLPDHSPVQFFPITILQPNGALISPGHLAKLIGDCFLAYTTGVSFPPPRVLRSSLSSFSHSRALVSIYSPPRRVLTHVISLTQIQERPPDLRHFALLAVAVADVACEAETGRSTAVLAAHVARIPYEPAHAPREPREDAMPAPGATRMRGSRARLGPYDAAGAASSGPASPRRRTDFTEDQRGKLEQAFETHPSLTDGLRHLHGRGDDPAGALAAELGVGRSSVMNWCVWLAIRGPPATE